MTPQSLTFLSAQLLYLWIGFSKMEDISTNESIVAPPKNWVKIWQVSSWSIWSTLEMNGQVNFRNIDYLPFKCECVGGDPLSRGAQEALALSPVKPHHQEMRPCCDD